MLTLLSFLFSFPFQCWTSACCPPKMWFGCCCPCSPFSKTPSKRSVRAGPGKTSSTCRDHSPGSSSTRWQDVGPTVVSLASLSSFQFVYPAGTGSLACVLGPQILHTFIAISSEWPSRFVCCVVGLMMLVIKKMT